MDIDTLINDIISREGGYSNHPADRGGPTRWGITEEVARSHGYTGDMRVFLREDAVAIYRARYWDGPRFAFVAELAPKIAAEMFDTGVNMGPAVAAGFLQRALNALNRDGRDFPDIVVDRQVGPRTLAALGRFMKVRGGQWRGRASKGNRGVAGRKLYQSGRESPGAGSVSLWLACKPYRLIMGGIAWDYCKASSARSDISLTRSFPIRKHATAPSWNC